MENGKMIYGGGDISVGMTSTIDDEVKKQAALAFNAAAEAKKQELDSHIKSELETAKEISEKMDSMEIVPVGAYVLVRPYKKNPFEMLEIQDGILVPTHDNLFKSPDTGEIEEEYNFSVQADVIEVGPACKYVKEGDIVYYRRAQGIPIPFFKQGFEVVSENQIQVVINTNVKERFEKYGR